MTDGITASRRDNDILIKISDINDIQRDFIKNHSFDLANKVITNLNEFEKMPKGYRLSPPYEDIKELKKEYKEYLSSGNPDKLIKLLDSDPAKSL